MNDIPADLLRVVVSANTILFADDKVYAVHEKDKPFCEFRAKMHEENSQVVTAIRATLRDDDQHLLAPEATAFEDF